MICRVQLVNMHVCFVNEEVRTWEKNKYDEPTTYTEMKCTPT